MPHWLDGVARILDSSSRDLKHLAAIAGVDPTYIYRYADLSKCDLRGQDLRGLDLTGAKLEGAILDSATKIDPEFDPRSVNRQYIRVRVNRILIGIINSQASHHHYTYAIWYAKNIAERAAGLMRRHKQYIDILSFIESHTAMKSFYECKKRDDYYVRHVLIYPSQWNTINEILIHAEPHDRFSLAIFAMMIFSETNSSLTDHESALEILLERRDRFATGSRKSGMSLF